jgi:hypothetical protein
MLSERDFQEVVSNYNCRFLRDLEGAARREVSSGNQRIADATDDDKPTVFNDCMQKIQETMVAAVKVWVPKYHGLADAHRSIVADPVEWTHCKMWEVIGRHLRGPDLQGAVAWWLIGLSDGDLLNRLLWQMPRWMIDPSDGEVLSLQDEHGKVRCKLLFALNSELENLKIDRLVAQVSTDGALPSAVAADNAMSEPAKGCSESPIGPAVAGAMTGLPEESSKPVAALDAIPFPDKVKRYRSDLKKQVALHLLINREATDRDILVHLGTKHPRLIPDEWKQDSSLAGHTFTKIRRDLLGPVNSRLPDTKKKSITHK